MSSTINRFNIKFNKFLFLLLSALLFSCSPWSSETNEALKMAGENREELEKVLMKYSENPKDSLKLKAAEYLISNMVFQYSEVGDKIDSLNSYYKYVYGMKGSDRHAFFSHDSLSKKIKGESVIKFDIQNTKSKYIIDQIEEAFKVYDEFEWCKKYSFDLFCEYILPYKISNYSNTNWKSYVRNKFYPSLGLMSFEDKNTLYEAEDFTKTASFKKKVSNASEGAVFHLYPKGKNKFEMSFDSKKKGLQQIYIHYINGNKTASNIRIEIDDKVIGNFIFPSIGDWTQMDFYKLPIELTVNLAPGEHKLSMVSLDQNIYIDFVFIPKNIHTKFPLSLKDGIYYLRNAAGWLTSENDSLFNLSNFKITKDFSKALAVKVRSKGLFYELTVKKDSIEKAIDAIKKNNNDSIIAFDRYGNYNQSWGILPKKGHGFEIRNRATNNVLSSNKLNTVIQSLKNSPNNSWQFIKDNKAKSIDTLDSAIKAAIKISEITNRFYWYGENGIGTINPINLVNYHYGPCPAEVDNQTILLRSLGVASAIDFIFSWGDRPSGHQWSVVFDHKGKMIQNNCHNPVGEILFWINQQKKGKVYRKTNSINRNSLFIKNNGKENIPQNFNTPYILDVTKEYCKTHDASIKITNPENVNKKFGYLMVFNNKDWTPIGWGEIRDNAIQFKSLEQNVLYLPALYNDQQFNDSNNPFYIDSIGKVHPFKADQSKKQTVTLSRKYPFYKKINLPVNRIIGGKFQGSNKPDFSDAVTLGIATKDMVNPVFQTITTKTDKKFKYFRYLGPKDGFCNISEIDIFNDKGEKLSGKIIGTSGSFGDEGKTKEMIFDGDVLTYFDAPEASGSWAGLAFEKPVSISKIKFIGRNDGNMVEIGDDYELFYWNKGWKSLGRKVAKENTLVFKGAPTKALFLLHNHTKGSEERPFTIEKGKQIWW